MISVSCAMLDLEIVPERSLGCEAWEFVLGKSPRMFMNYVKILRCNSMGRGLCNAFLDELSINQCLTPIAPCILGWH